MKHIPTPFIGGSEGSRRGTPRKERFVAPYHPGAEDAKIEEEETLEKYTQLDESEVIEAPQFEAISDVDTIVVEAEATETAVPEEAAVGDVHELESAPAEVEQAEAIAAAAAAAESAADHHVAELPDFLLGTDGGAIAGPSEPAPQEAAATGAAESADLADLEKQAQELLQGPAGARIASLIEQLGGDPSDVSIPRAFAAGYLAAKAGQEG